MSHTAGPSSSMVGASTASITPPPHGASSQVLPSLDMLLRDLPLRPSTHALLNESGFTGTSRELIQSVRAGGMSQFADELGVDSPAEAARIHREIQQALERIGATPTTKTTAAQVLKREVSSMNIITFSRQIDEMLGGGIPLGHVTEISGAPGSGKTQLAMQLAVNAKLPTHYGGVAGDTLYLDTEGCFAPSRCWDMATALVAHIQQGRERRKRKHAEDPRPWPAWFTPTHILQGIHVYRVHDVSAQTAVLYHLEQRLEEHRVRASQENSDGTVVFPIRLVVVDSIAFHYRADITTASGHEYYVARTRHLTNLVARLSKLAEQYQLAIVAINQMTTKRSNSDISINSTLQQQHLEPALGVSWAHAVTTRLLLQKHSKTISNDANYCCHLTKSACQPSGTTRFQVCREGIRGLDHRTAASNLN